jgi:hypothetical protein
MPKRLLVFILAAIVALGATATVSYADKYDNGDLKDAKQNTQSAKAELAE